ncbi:MAG: response regulator transcription factor [Flavobacteriales bacterium]|nr:response regulator transcription factor [Flavobacteriales bacterium]
MIKASLSVKILLAGSQPLILGGLKSLISHTPGLEVCGEAPDPVALIQLAPVLNPDLIIVDRIFEGFFDEEILEEHDAFMSGYKVLIVSDFDKESIYKLHKLHISGLITTHASTDELNNAIRTIASGGKYFSAKVVEVLIELSFKKTNSQKLLHDDLSEREMEIFRLVTQGKTTKEIADELSISAHTVYTHRKNILKKLSCKNATDLINYAYSQGLMEKE